MSHRVYTGTKTDRWTWARPSVLMAPDTGKRREKRNEGGVDALETRQGVGSSAHLKVEKNTVPTASAASRRGTWLSSIALLSLAFGFAPLESNSSTTLGLKATAA